MRRRLRRPEGEQLIPALFLVAMMLFAYWKWAGEPPAVPPTPPADGGYLFCSWNVENLFDDVDDPADRDADENWFGQNPAMVQAKLNRLREAILMQAGGRGPDILVMVEVENRNAAAMLQHVLNKNLPAELAYNSLIFRENRTGRHIAPAILSRIPGRIDESLRFPATQRILAARFVVEGRPLTILASHWTSRLTDKVGTKRAAYADSLYRAVGELGPSTDVLLCGDFNDEPDAPSVRLNLHATGDSSLVRADDPAPYLLDLMADKPPDRFGTYEYKGRWQIFDQIVVTPGLLDPSGWEVLPETVRTENRAEFRSGRDGRPWRFGNERADGARGFSDHFAVTVRLHAG